MDLKESPNYYEFRDSELSMRVPEYLRPKKGMRFFAARSKKDHGHALINFALELADEELTKVVWSTILDTKDSDWMGVKQRIVRRGKATYLTNGLELLMTSHNSINGEVFHTYHLLFVVEPRTVDITFFGQGDLQTFEDLCRTITMSIRVMD